MAKIVLAAASSHSPLLAVSSEQWGARAQDDVASKHLAMSDGRVLDYAELLTESKGAFAGVATQQNWNSAADLCAASLDSIRANFETRPIDLVVIVGDDQGELFVNGNQPLVSAYIGPAIKTSNKLGVDGVPDWLKLVGPVYGMDRVREYPAAPNLASAIVRRMVEQGIDMGVITDIPDPEQAGVGHAFGFVVERLLPADRPPILPIFLNTFFPPNVPTPERAVEIGRALAAAIAELDGDLKVAVVASGGLSHFVVDEALDKQVLTCIEHEDLAGLTSIAGEALRSGSSEILNWIAVAAVAMESGLQCDLLSYVPVYRTPAGTGCGMGFVTWK